VSHLDEEQVLRAACVGGGPLEQRRRCMAAALAAAAADHLAGCNLCGERVGAQARLVAAARVVDRESVGAITVPAFEVALAPHLAELRPVGSRTARARRPVVADAATVPVAVPAPGLAASWRLAASVVGRQARLLPRLLSSLSLLGLVAAVALALAVPVPDAAVRLFTAAVTVVVMGGAGAVCASRWDPRHELLAAMPVSPRVVFLARLVLVLAADLLGAVLASLAAALLGLPIGVGQLILGWLGPALLAAAVSVVLSVWRSVWLGSMVGAAAWLLGLLGSLPGPGSSRAGVAHLTPQWATTTPGMLALALALLAAAVRIVGVTAPARTS
jgi:hypothetical protein